MTINIFINFWNFTALHRRNSRLNPCDTQCNMLRGLHALLIVSILPSFWCASTKTNLQTPHDQDPWRLPIARPSKTLLMSRLFQYRLDLSLDRTVEENRDRDFFVGQVSVERGLAKATLVKIAKISFRLFLLFRSGLCIFYVQLSFSLGLFLS